VVIAMLFPLISSHVCKASASQLRVMVEGKGYCSKGVNPYKIF
jgi:hypothetical protein